MAQSDDPAQAASRLEAALERIANAAVRPRDPGAPVDEVAARLDGLIAQLRQALGASGAASSV